VKLGTGSFFRFAVGGGINTVLTYLLFLLLSAFMPYVIAYTITYIAGIALSYVINSFFVFRTGRGWKAMIRFPIAYAVQQLIVRRGGAAGAAQDDAPPSVAIDAVPPATGTKCPECGARAMIRKDGCDFCTRCGHLGSCG